MKKRLPALLLTVLFVIATFSPAIFAEDKEIVKVGYVEGYAMVRDIESINNKGYGYELLQHIEPYTDYEFEYHSYDLSNMFSALEAGEVDIIGPVFKNPTVTNEYVYSATGNDVGLLLAVRKSSEEKYYYADAQAMNGKTVMTYEGNPANEHLEEYARANSISFEYKYESFGGYDDSADLYLISTIEDDAASDYYSVLNLAKVKMQLVTKAENSAIIDAIDKGLASALTTKGDLMYDLYEKYYGDIPGLSARGITREEAESLDREFSVAYLSTHQPFQFTNENNLPDGISVEILNNLADEHGFFVEYVPFVFGQYSLDMQKPDLLITLLGDYAEILQLYTPTDAYYSVPLMLITGANADVYSDISSIGMLEYASVDREIISQNYGAEISLFDNLEELISAYNSGKVSAIVVTQSGSDYTTAMLGTDGIQTHDMHLDLPMTMYVANEFADEYVNIFNVMFDRISEGSYDEIFFRQQADFIPAYTAGDFIADYWPLAVLALLLVAALFTVNQLRQASRKQKAIDKIVNTDPVSGHISMHRFKELAPPMLQEPDSHFEVVSLDIDYFRMINNLFGNEKGDSVIAAMSDAINEALRETDSIFVRANAEQFTILRRTNEGVTPFVLCKKYIEPAVKAVVGQSYNLSLSVGVCVLSDEKITLTMAMDYANVARQKGKVVHKMTVHTFDKAIKEEYDTRTNITYRMERALEDREFYPVFQPKIDLDTLTINGAEALVRWKPKLGDRISPATFIPVFEANGFIKELDLYMFDAICRFMKAHYRNTPLPVISVNLSTITIVEDDIKDRLIEILRKYKFKASDFELEITESALIDAVDAVSARVLQLKNAGFTVSLDDFGAGASTLNKLSSFDVDVLKLDKAFLDHNITNKGGTIIVENIIKMAIELDMDVVCEGIETMGQAMWLKSLGCHTAQGYYFERPVEADDFIKLLQSHKVYNFEIPHDEDSAYYEELIAQHEYDELEAKRQKEMDMEDDDDYYDKYIDYAAESGAPEAEEYEFEHEEIVVEHEQENVEIKTDFLPEFIHHDERAAHKNFESEEYDHEEFEVEDEHDLSDTLYGAQSSFEPEITTEQPEPKTEDEEREARLRKIEEQRARSKQVAEKLAREREEERALAKAKAEQKRNMVAKAAQEKEKLRLDKYKNSPAAQARAQSKARTAEIEAQKRLAAKEKVQKIREKNQDVILPDFLNTQNMSEDARKRVEALVANILKKRNAGK